MSKHQCLRGMRDLTPKSSERLEYITQLLKSIAIHYGYQPIHFPILESVSLFQKSIGTETDIISQEMYAFEDKNGDQIALRPEGTAGCLRSVLSNGLIQRQKQKLFYAGPMFRRERPQKGRFRQFTQFGVEVFGYPSGEIDVELILMSQRMCQSLDLKNLTLHVNYLGSIESRNKYHHLLQAYWKSVEDKLSDDEKTRAKTNPLRLLDSKNPALKDLIENAPAIRDCLSDVELETYQSILNALEKNGIAFQESNRLVRGLDYYSDFIFEWMSDDLGAQSTILGGGRYDALVKSMGEEIPSLGFAIGIDRIEAILNHDIPRAKKVCVSFENQDLYQTYHHKLEILRNLNHILYIDQSFGKLKSKLNFAKQNESDYLFYIGEESKLFSFDDNPAQTIDFDAFIDFYQQL